MHSQSWPKLASDSLKPEILGLVLFMHLLFNADEIE